VYLTPGRCKVGPGIGRMRTKPDMERLGSLLNGDVIIRVKIGDLHATLLVSVVRLPRRNRMRGYCACSILARHDGRHAARQEMRMFTSKQRPIVIPQWEHQKLAGTLALLWGNADFDRPPIPFESFLTGIALHDRAYGLLDNLPIGGIAEEQW